MIKINPNIEIDEKDIKEEFIRSSGPGGQHVNKVSSAVQLRFNLKECKTLSDGFKKKLKKLAGKRCTNHGIIIIEAKKFRNQERNRLDALERLKKLILKAALRQKKRRPTNPSKVAIEQRLKEKKHHQEIKKSRQKIILKED